MVTTGLVNFDAAYRALAVATTVDEAREIADAAQAFRVYAKRAGLGLDMQNKAAEMKLRAERRCGELLRDMEKHPGGRPPQTPSTVELVLPRTLAEMGVDPHDSHRWQRVAAVPMAELERYIADKRDSGGEITTAGLLARRDTSALQSSESYEWYTPAQYIEAARRVLYVIDLDPASTAKANEIVRAARYFTEDDDGLAQEWHGGVWLNPPYGGLQAAFTERLVAEYRRGHTTAAILLVSAHATDTDWFRPLWDHVMCFTDHRIDFLSPDGIPQAGSTHGSVFVYFGSNWDGFYEEFGGFGPIVSRYTATHSEP